MRKFLATIIISLFFIPLYAQTSGWEVTDQKNRNDFNLKGTYEYKRKSRSKDKNGNEWKIVDYKLCKIKENDTLRFDDFPLIKKEWNSSYAITGNNESNVQIGPQNHVAFAFENYNPFLEEGKRYLGVCDGSTFKYYDISKYLIHIYEIFMTEKRVYLNDIFNDKMIYFDLQSNEIHDVENYDDFYKVYTDDSTFLLTLNGNQSPLLLTDNEDGFHNVLPENMSVWWGFNSDNDFLFISKDSIPQFYRFNSSGLNKLSDSGLEGLGEIEQTISVEEEGVYNFYKNGVVFYNKDHLIVSKLDKQFDARNFRINSQKQDNGIVQFWIGTIVLTSINGNILSAADSYFNTSGARAFYKENDDDKFFYYSPWTQDSLAGKELYIVKNRVDTSVIRFPENVVRVYNLLVTDKYLWAYVSTMENTQVLRFDKTRKLISGMLFYDINKNGISDLNEYGVSEYPIIIKPSGLKLYPSETGEFSFAGDIDAEYTIEISDTGLFKYTSVQFPYSVKNTEKNLIGITLINPVAIIKPAFEVSRSRCSVKSAANLAVTNSGFADAEKVKIILKGNNLGKLTEVENSLPVEDNKIEFEISDLKFKDVKNLPYFIEWGSGEFTGKFAEFSLQAELYKDNELVSVIYDTISSEIRCSWDPNDIAVTPAGVEDMHYTKMNSTLSYLIRFENTGNDTAYNVVVYDTLNADLDYTTVKVLGSSHAVQTEINHGIVAFRFAIIMLPDANTNKEKAQGFVRFSVKPKANLEDYTVIRNKAGIVFDQNSPVITNEVFNTMGDAPKVAGTTETETVKKFMVYPNPSTGILNVKGNNVKEVQMFNNLGEMVLQSDKSIINVEQLQSAVYHIKFYDTNGMLIANEMFVKTE